MDHCSLVLYSLSLCRVILFIIIIIFVQAFQSLIHQGSQVPVLFTPSKSYFGATCMCPLCPHSLCSLCQIYWWGYRSCNCLNSSSVIECDDLTNPLYQVKTSRLLCLWTLCIFLSSRELNVFVLATFRDCHRAIQCFVCYKACLTIGNPAPMFCLTFSCSTTTMATAGLWDVSISWYGIRNVLTKFSSVPGPCNADTFVATNCNQRRFRSK